MEGLGGAESGGRRLALWAVVFVVVSASTLTASLATGLDPLAFVAFAIGIAGVALLVLASRKEAQRAAA